VCWNRHLIPGARRIPTAEHYYAVLVWAVMNNLLTRSIFHDRSMTGARRINDRFLDLLRLRFEAGS
jgi:hypothetical protein